MQVSTDTYIYPPRAQMVVPPEETNFLNSLGWICQYKYNDTRIIIKIHDNHIELWNRHASRLRSYTCPDWLHQEINQVADHLNLQRQHLHMLDGGLLDTKQKAIQDTICIWDILVKDNQQLLGTTYAQRQEMLPTTNPWYYLDHHLGNHICPDTPHIFSPHPIQNTKTAWENIQKINAPYEHGQIGDPNYRISPVLEGLIYKDPNAPLTPGFKEKNNTEWQIKSRIHTGRHIF